MRKTIRYSIILLTLAVTLQIIWQENPLLRSGLALAGANTALTTEGETQGIVSAEKILGLRLRGTEVVVLSACETGVGTVQAGEGVYGLRRAFLQAGAQSLVMSLWSVPDNETKELMIRFYQNFLSDRMTRGQALREAMLQQKQVVTNAMASPIRFIGARLCSSASHKTDNMWMARMMLMISQKEGIGWRSTLLQHGNHG